MSSRCRDRPNLWGYSEYPAYVRNAVLGREPFPLIIEIADHVVTSRKCGDFDPIRETQVALLRAPEVSLLRQQKFHRQVDHDVVWKRVIIERIVLRKNQLADGRDAKCSHRADHCARENQRPVWDNAR